MHIVNQTELLRLRKACNDAFNWSDFGHWIGRGAQPNCESIVSIRKKSKITIKWHTANAVEMWNHRAQVQGRRVGYIVNFLIGLGAIYSGGSVATILSTKLETGVMYTAAIALGVNTVSDVAMGESLAKLPSIVPRVGDTLEIEIEFHSMQFVSKYQRDKLVVKTKRTHLSAEGNVRLEANSGTDQKALKTVIEGQDFPLELVSRIMSSNFLSKTINLY